MGIPLKTGTPIRKFTMTANGTTQMIKHNVSIINDDYLIGIYNSIGIVWQHDETRCFKWTIEGDSNGIDLYIIYE